MENMEELKIDPGTMFTGVISSTSLMEDAVTELQGCPRTALGLSCLLPDYPCLCSQVRTWAAEETKNQDGDTAVFTLHLRLLPGVGDALAVIESVDLIGFKADMVASRDAVTASFRLSRPQNAHLKSYLLETESL